MSPKSSGTWCGLRCWRAQQQELLPFPGWSADVLPVAMAWRHLLQKWSVTTVVHCSRVVLGARMILSFMTLLHPGSKKKEDLEQGWICSGARMLNPNAIVWRGNRDIPSTKEGLKILGCPVGHPDFVQDQLSKLSDRHDVLLGCRNGGRSAERMALVGLLCAARANFFLRSVSLGQISTFASHHDDQTWACVTHSSRMGATLPLRLGGLGFSSAVRLRYAAHWASWTDCIRMVQQRHPIVARTIIEAVEADDPAQTAQGVVSSINSLRTAGFVIPS